MSTVTITIGGLNLIEIALEELESSLQEVLAPATEEVVVATYETISALYPNMEPYWTLRMNTVPDALASVTAQTNDVFVRWFEFGTPAHTFRARRVAALSFAGTHAFVGTTIVTPQVSHPGAKAHALGTDLLYAMGVAATTAWSTALMAILTST